jgi:hypothetical protein
MQITTRVLVRVVMSALLLLFTIDVPAEAQGSGGTFRYPRTDAENRGLRKKAPKRIKIDRRSLRGDVIARGNRVDKNKDGRFTFDECEFDYELHIGIAQGGRRVSVLNDPGSCTSVLEEVEDADVVEPEENNVAMVTPGVFHHARKAIGNLWEALFPKLLAQTWYYRKAYNDILTCGVVCPPPNIGPTAGDGLTMIQGFTNYRYRPYSAIEMQDAWAWWCTDGWRRDPLTNEVRSYCQPPAHKAGSPMFPEWTGWWSYNQFVTERIWSGRYIKAAEQASFFFMPWNTAPRLYDHTMFNLRDIDASGNLNCFTAVTGSYVRGPSRLYYNCLLTQGLQ